MNTFATIKNQLKNMLDSGQNEDAYNLLLKNARSEYDNIANDPQYCILAAATLLANNQLSGVMDFIALGLLKDPKNYELYLILGEYYSKINPDQALLCYYQSLFYCDIEEDRAVVESCINNAIENGAEIRKISFVIVAKDQSENLKKCLDSIVSTVIPELFDIVVVDNASLDETDKWLSEIEGITYYRIETDIGFTKACNIGIKLSNPFNDVFLLDADALLLDNSLFYLMLGLYSDENVGIVSGFTNDYVNGQKVLIGADCYDKIIEFANSVNCPMQSAYEESVYVSDFAMLINRRALDKVGLFDEAFSPLGYEDKDFCTRVNMAGMKVILCFNSMILKTMDKENVYTRNNAGIREDNRTKYVDKWGCDADYSNSARDEIIAMIGEEDSEPIEVLELGCCMGCTLNRIKRIWPDSKVHGIEYVQAAANIGACISDIIQGDVENMEIPYSRKQFDYIICADVLEHLRDPQRTLQRFKPYLKDGGRFIISIPNVRHYAVIMMLALQGRFDYSDSGILDNTHIRFFTKDTALEMIEGAGLKVTEIQRNYNGNPESNSFIEGLASTFDITDPEELKVFQYYFVAE